MNEGEWKFSKENSQELQHSTEISGCTEKKRTSSHWNDKNGQKNGYIFILSKPDANEVSFVRRESIGARRIDSICLGD